MKIVRSVLNTAMAAIGGSLAGGAAGGAAWALVGSFPSLLHLLHAKSLAAAAGGFAIYLGFAIAGAFFGLIGGLIFGLIPTLLLGMVLTHLRDMSWFKRLPVWMAMGAAVAAAIYLWVPYMRPTAAMDTAQLAGWLVAWAVAGATAMAVYWAAAVAPLGRQPPMTR